MVPCTSQAAAAAIGEARDIADNLRCQPLLDRAADITPAQSPVADEITPLPDPEESNGLAAVTIAVICKLVTAPAPLLLTAALAAFAGVLITATIISFHRDSPAPPRPGLTPGHLTPDRAPRHDQGHQTAQALTRHAHQNGHQAKKGHTGSKDQPPKPSRR